MKLLAERLKKHESDNNELSKEREMKKSIPFDE